MIEYLVISLGIQVLMFLPAFVFKTDKLTDLSYSVTFVLLTLIAFLFNTWQETKLLLLIMISLWGFRLGTFLFIRIKKWKRDKRFDGMRESFSKFLSFWVIQGITVFVLLIPTFQYLKNEPKTSMFTLIGVLVFSAGLVIETIADYQKFKSKKRILRTGLWKYSRHPNYFGEILVWLGVYLFTMPVSGFLGLISPVFITFMLVFVSGIPKIEKKYENNKEYQEYKKETPALIPFLKF